MLWDLPSCWSSSHFGWCTRAPTSPPFWFPLLTTSHVLPSTPTPTDQRFTFTFSSVSRSFHNLCKASSECFHVPGFESANRKQVSHSPREILYKLSSRCVGGKMPVHLALTDLIGWAICCHFIFHFMFRLSEKQSLTDMKPHRITDMLIYMYRRTLPGQKRFKSANCCHDLGLLQLVRSRHSKSAEFLNVLKDQVIPSMDFFFVMARACSRTAMPRLTGLYKCCDIA